MGNNKVLAENETKWTLYLTSEKANISRAYDEERRLVKFDTHRTVKRGTAENNA